MHDVQLSPSPSHTHTHTHRPRSLKFPPPKFPTQYDRLSQQQLGFLSLYRLAAGCKLRAAAVGAGWRALNTTLDANISDTITLYNTNLILTTYRPAICHSWMHSERSRIIAIDTSRSFIEFIIITDYERGYTVHCYARLAVFQTVK